MSRIVITGVGVVSAIGCGKEATLSALLGGKSGIAPVAYLPTVHRTMPVGEVKYSDAELHDLAAVEADGGQVQSRATLLGRLALREAMTEAGLLAPDASSEGAFPDVALVSGTTVANMDRGEKAIVDAESLCDQFIRYRVDCGSSTEDVARGVGEFAMLDTLSTACSSAANALVVGANMLRTGRYGCVVAGGTESLSRLHFNGFKTLMILDAEPCRPFDATRAGLNLGEGAAYLVLETEEHAQQRGAKPLGVLSGYGNACDAYHQTASSPDGEGAFLAMQEALRMAGLTAADVDYVNAHGTGTPNNDPSELAAMHRLFGATLPPFSSTKGFTGHTTSASGAIEAVFCLLALRQQMLLPNLNCQQPIEGEPMPVVAGVVPQRPLQHILCNAFGFGGNDTSLALSTVDAGRPLACVPATSKPVYVLSHVTLPCDSDPDFKQYMTPGEARRLGRLLKRTLAVSIMAKHEAGDVQPEAIITASTWGSIESSERFMREVLAYGEEKLSPTHFMQSTQNTLSGLVAISMHNHGYNNTHSQGDTSLKCALLDAWMLMQLGQAQSVLVGCHDAWPTMRNEVYLLTTVPHPGAVDFSNSIIS